MRFNPRISQKAQPSQKASYRTPQLVLITMELV